MKISKLEFSKSRKTAPDGVSRREVLTRLLAGTVLAGVWSSASAAAALQAGAIALATSNVGLSKAQMAVLAAAADIIIPVTDTPGAVEAGVPLFIDGLVAHWMSADEAAQFRSGLAALEASAQQRYQRGFAACTAEQGGGLLQTLRQASPYQGRTFSLVDRILDPRAPFYLRLRDLVVFAYFTSETGSTRELRYVPVPGKFEGNVDMKTWPYQIVI